MTALDASPPTLPLVGGRYRLLEPLGDGAVGAVYRALHVGLGREFAVKFLKAELAADPESLDRFEREARILGRLRHPNVVDVTDFGVAEAGALPAELGEDCGARPFLVLELLAGETLADLCRREGALSWERAGPILGAVAAALDAVHAAGIVHRDLKPGNVMLARGAAGETAVNVLDFGLSGFFDRRSRSAATAAPPGEPAAAAETNFLLGTPLYTAPELADGSGRASVASDLYSFGVMTYELLLGRPPFAGSARDVLLGHRNAEPPPPAALGVDLPAALWQAVRAPLAKDPAARPPTARAVVAALEAAAAAIDRERWRRRFRPRQLGLAALLSTLLLGLALALPEGGVPPLERWLSDLRLALAPRSAPDPRILLVTLDDSALAARTRPDGTPLPLADPAWADEIAGGLERAFAAGARGVAIDGWAGAGWGSSERFSSFLLAHADRVVLGVEAADGRVYGTGVVDGLTAAALGEDAAQLFGFLDLEEEADGVIRHGRTAFRGRDGAPFPSWAERTARLLGSAPPAGRPWTFALDGRIDWRRYPQVAWGDLAGALARRPELFRGRLVLFGSAWSSDRHRIPGRPGRPQAIPGIVLQALFVDTLARGLPIRESPPWPFLLAGVLLAGIGMVPILDRRWTLRGVAALALLVPAYLAGAWLVFRQAGLAWPLTGPSLLAVAAAALAVAARPLLPQPARERSR